MKRITIILGIMCVSTLIHAQSRTETFDDNKWQWTERTTKCNSVVINDGKMTLTTAKFDKKATDIWHQIATTFGRVPMRPRDNYRMTIKAIIPTDDTNWSLLFNFPKNCLEMEEGETQFDGYSLMLSGNEFVLAIGDGQKHTDKLPIKFQKKDQPFEIVITKKRNTAIFEINGMQIYKGDCQLTEPCIGFNVLEEKQSIIIDEVKIEQAEADD